MVKKSNGGGTVLDWGVYCIQFCLLAFKGVKPDKVTAVAIKVNEDGVDLGLSATLNFPGDGLATFNTDLRVNLPNRAIIAGTKGIITVSDQATLLRHCFILRATLLKRRALA
jgi:dihydrodiol dehydrogenase / D-xylose 1-dehydrogenase (NADP)